MSEFKDFKTEILNRAKKAGAGAEEYRRAYSSNNAKELCEVIKGNFSFCINTNILTPNLFDKYADILNSERIYCNVDVVDGYLGAWGNSTVTAWGNSTVTARENSTVTARENSTVTARENSTVTAWENSTVTAWENSTVTARGNSTVTARENSYCIVKSFYVEAFIYDNAIIRSNNKIVLCDSIEKPVYYKEGSDANK